MTTFFTNIGGMIGKGFSTLANTIMFPYDITKNVAVKFTSSFFPTAQKTTITNDQVSTQPYTSFLGYRPQTKDAVTTGTEYQSWWNKAYEYGRGLWDNFRTSFMGYSWNQLGKDFGTTAASVVGQTSQKLIQTLPDYFMQKWGLVERPDTGEKLENTPYKEPYPVIFLNPTQSTAPATQSTGIIDFFKSMLSSQPQGTYNIGFPQQEPIPISIPVPVGSSAVDTQQSSTWMIIILVVLAAVLFIAIKKGK